MWSSTETSANVFSVLGVGPAIGRGFPASPLYGREATEAEETNWRNWYILARIEDEAGNAEASATAYDRAVSLNPRSPLFAG